jgi:hypothetical protein
MNKPNPTDGLSSPSHSQQHSDLIDGKNIYDATEKTTPVDADVLAMCDSVASYIIKKLTWANLKAALGSGWSPYSAVTPTRASADDPTYVLTFAGVDLTGAMSVGMKVKFTQNSATVYGIITAISFSTNTTMTLYCGTDYDVLDTGTYAISAFNYSPHKAPFGFPLNPTKWTVEATDTTQRSQASPTNETWYNLGSVTISIPIGSWNTEFFVLAGVDRTTAGYLSVFATLSTANDSESDTDLTGSGFWNFDNSASVWAYTFICRRKTLNLASKTSYYLNTKTIESSIANIYNPGNYSKTIIRAVCAYL